MGTIQLWELAARGCRSIGTGGAASLDAAMRQLNSSLYTTFRTFGGGKKVVGLRMHLRRLYGPAGRLGIKPEPDAKVLRMRIAECIPTGIESRVRLVLSGAGGFYLAQELLEAPAGEVYEHGTAAITLSGKRERPELKLASFIETSQPEREEVRAAHVFEGLLVSNSRFLEGLTSSFFYVKAGFLGTARSGVLPGVTRSLVIRAARRAGVQVSLRALHINELRIIEEAFITSSSRGIVPLVRIDDEPVGAGEVGPLTKRLMGLYQAEIESRAEPIVVTS